MAGLILIAGPAHWSSHSPGGSLPAREPVLKGQLRREGQVVRGKPCQGRVHHAHAFAAQAAADEKAVERQQWKARRIARQVLGHFVEVMIEQSSAERFFKRHSFMSPTMMTWRSGVRIRRIDDRLNLPHSRLAQKPEMHRQQPETGLLDAEIHQHRAARLQPRQGQLMNVVDDAAAIEHDIAMPAVAA